MVETAGHDRAVDEHADLIAQTIAEAALSPVRRVERGPVEFVVLGQKDPLCELDAACPSLPRRGEARFKLPQDRAVEALAPAAVPKPELADLSFRGGLSGKSGALVYITFKL